MVLKIRNTNGTKGITKQTNNKYEILEKQRLVSTKVFLLRHKQTSYYLYVRHDGHKK